MKKLACLFILALALSAFGQATTSVMFPVNSMFGGAIAGKPITITAQNALASDGVNIWAGTYTIIPPSATNPVIGLYPGQYLMTIAGVVKPSRFTVPTTTNVLDVTRLITSGPLIYFNPTNGLFNLWPGSGVTFVTNSDGSITVSSTGGATNASFANLLAGSNITLVTNSGGIVINSTVGAITASQVTGLANGATNATGTNLMDAAKGIAGFQWLQHLTSGSTNPGSVQIAADSAWGGGPWIDMDNTLDQITIHAAVVNFSDVATATVSGQFYGHLFGDADTADLASLATGLAPGSASNLLAAAVQPGTAPSLGLANVTGTLPAATLPGNVVTNIFALVTNNNASAVTISNTLSANIIVGNTLELNLPFVGPSILANRFGIVNPSTGNQLADAGGVYGPLGQKIIDNNGRAGAYDAGLLTNLPAANLVGTIPAATLPGNVVTNIFNSPNGVNYNLGSVLQAISYGNNSSSGATSNNSVLISGPGMNSYPSVNIVSGGNTWYFTNCASAGSDPGQFAFLEFSSSSGGLSVDHYVTNAWTVAMGSGPFVFSTNNVLIITLANGFGNSATNVLLAGWADTNGGVHNINYLGAPGYYTWSGALGGGILTNNSYTFITNQIILGSQNGASFIGNGSGLTNLPAQTNTILAGLAGLPNTNAIVYTNSAGVTLAGTFSGNGSGLTNYGQFCEFDGTNTATTFETNWTSTPTVRGSVILGNAALGTMSNTIAPVTVEIELGGTPTASPNGSIPLHQLYTNGVAVPYAYIWSAGAGWRCTWGKVKVTLPAPNVMMQWSNSSGANMVNAWWKTTVQ